MNLIYSCTQIDNDYSDLFMCCCDELTFHVCISYIFVL